MKHLKIALLLMLSFNYAQAQDVASEDAHYRKIEINNDNGELTITFKEGEITEFIINDKPVALNRYSDYQSIIDDFAEEEIAHPTPPTPPTPPEIEESGSEQLCTLMSEYLMKEGHLKSFTKFKIHLKKKELKVNGKKMSDAVHHACLDIFEEIYGQRLNSDSEAKFKKSKGNSKSSVRIVE